MNFRTSIVPVTLHRYCRLIPVTLIFTGFFSCTHLDFFEKSAAIPGFAWSSSYTPTISFDITDTTALYDVDLVLRHNEQYNYSNIWLALSVSTPTDSIPPFRIEKTLATNDAGWLGTGMDDIYEHRISINQELAEHRVSFRSPGRYTFTFRQIMREDPLRNILNVGLHIEKKR